MKKILFSSCLLCIANIFIGNILRIKDFTDPKNMTQMIIVFVINGVVITGIINAMYYDKSAPNETLSSALFSEENDDDSEDDVSGDGIIGCLGIILIAILSTACFFLSNWIN